MRKPSNLIQICIFILMLCGCSRRMDSSNPVSDREVMVIDYYTLQKNGTFKLVDLTDRAIQEWSEILKSSVPVENNKELVYVGYFEVRDKNGNIDVVDVGVSSHASRFNYQNPNTFRGIISIGGRTYAPRFDD